MTARENILTEWVGRCFGVTGVLRVARNPESPPAVDELPAIHILELDEQTVSQSKANRSTGTTYTKKLSLAMEMFVAGSTEGLASQELGEFVALVRAAIHAGGPTLGGLCWLSEGDATRVEAVPVGDHVRAIGYGYEVQYTEMI